MKRLVIALSALAFTVAGAMACTPEEVQAKATELSTHLQELVAKDPVKAGEVGQRLGAMQGHDVASIKDLGKVCKLYDDMLAEVAAE